MNLLSRYANSNVIRRIRSKVLPNIWFIFTRSSIRRCGCCERVSIFLQFGPENFSQSCLLCGTTFRYEMLATLIRAKKPVEGLRVLELDPDSPLRLLLEKCAQYTRSYYRPGHQPGSIRFDGAVMEDITALTFPDNSLDLIVSSDVLEHVPDVMLAFKETFRVLKPGGVHVFTVPSSNKTTRLAVVEEGMVKQIVFPPEYHSDPLDPKGILAFWHFGPDLSEYFMETGLVFKRVQPFDVLNRELLVWEAHKPVARVNDKQAEIYS
jgi:SAM-dependent methyltransferase